MRKFIFLLVFILGFALPASSSVLYWSGYDWRTIHTENFEITYHQGEQQLAYRVAVIAEQVLSEITQRLDFHPREKIRMILSDDQDDSNGSSSTLPVNTVRLYMATPHPDSSLDDYDDWLHMLISHELTHTVHIDMHRGFVSALRYTFGRIITFNHFSPVFEIEGYAVMHETEMAKEGGRGQSVYSDMIVRGEWQSDSFPSIDEISNWTSTWPAGARPYILGGVFETWVSEQVEGDVWARIAKRHSGEIWPFLHNYNARKEAGKRLHQLYADWQRHLDLKYTALRMEVEKKGETKSERISFTGNETRRPIFSPDNKSVYFVEATGHRIGRINRYDLESGKTKRVIRSGDVGDVDLVGNRLFYTSAETFQTFKIFFDLFSVDTDGKNRERFTKGRRARDVAAFPDGSGLLVIANELERPTLFRFDPKTGDEKILYTPEENDDLIQLSQPTIAPSGKTAAMTVWHEDGNRDIFTFDIETKTFRRRTSHRERDLSPAFSADGRYLYFTSGRTGVYNIFALRLADDKLFQVTNVLGGAFDPAPSPDGNKLAFAAYGPDGFDVHLMDIDPDKWFPCEYYPPKNPGFGVSLIGQKIAEEAAKAKEKYDETDYTIWRTIWPRYWRPAIGSVEGNLSLGVVTGGSDPLYRHIYNISTLYSWESEFLSYGVSYTYARFLPNITLAHSRSAVYYGPVLFDQQGNRRNYWEERLSGYFTLSVPVNSDVTPFVGYVIQDRDELTEVSENTYAPIETGIFSGTRLGLLYDGTSYYRESISPVDGIQAGITHTLFSPAFGSDYDVQTLLGNANFYAGMPFWNHVFAARLAAGVAFGDELYLRAFRLGGFTNDQILAQVSENSIFLRGYDRASRRGQQVVAGSVEYRLPIWRMEWGVRTWPFFFDTLSMVVFSDAGTAGTDDMFEKDLLTSAGGELHLRTFLAYYYPIQFRFGGAYGFYKPDIIGGYHWILTLGGSF